MEEVESSLAHIILGETSKNLKKHFQNSFNSLGLNNKNQHFKGSSKEKTESQYLTVSGKQVEFCSMFSPG